jgi:hypothetical protein
MPRLFIFAIGGTGSRVVKSLTMLLASGVKAKQDYEIVPIIIDPHDAGEASKTTISLLKNYQKVTNKVGTKSGFFGTKISTLGTLAADGTNLTDSFGFKLKDITNKKFGDYINHGLLTGTNKDLVDLLFSGISKDKDGNDISLLDIDMDIGFVGNPNIGSIVLHQFKDSQEFTTFKGNCNPINGDRIFIISSIFGGTGAAGFPTILKILREDDRLGNAKIGAITVMPYFNVETDKDSPIKQSDFIPKTKAALHYYENNVAPSVNALYYIADKGGKEIKNDPGDGEQPNPPHPVELFSALSIIDFLNIGDNELVTNGEKPVDPIYKGFAIKEIEIDNKKLKFKDLGEDTYKQIAFPIAQFAMFVKFCNSYLKNSLSQPWATDENTKKNANAPTSDEYIYPAYKEFLTAYETWLKGLGDNERGFDAVNIYRELANIIVDGKIGEYRSLGILPKKSDEARLNGFLNNFANGKTFDNPAQRITKVLFEGTREILTKDFALANQPS